jgi:hypothetical protein
MKQTYISPSTFQSTPSQIAEVDTAGRVGLSYSPYLTVLPKKRLHITRYSTGEIKVSTQEVYKPDMGESRQKPPLNTGERVVEGLSKKGRRRIRIACNYYGSLPDAGDDAMITLTYGAISKSGHKESKQDLDRFLKSFSRHVKSKYRIKDIHYVWVAEIQPKRLKRTGEAVIHYHVVCPYYVDKDLVSKWWNNAVNRPRAKANLPTQKLGTNVKGGVNAGKYIGKYLSKEGHKIKGNGYNMSQATSKAIKPIFNECIDIEEGRVEEIYSDLISTAKTHTIFRHVDEDGLSRCLWMADSNDYLFNELIKYTSNADYERI